MRAQTRRLPALAVALLGLCILVFAQTPSSAATYNFALSDHPDGAKSPPFEYGIRMDNWNKFFSFEIPGGVGLTVKDDLGMESAIMQGVVIENSSTDDIVAAWLLDYEFTGLTMEGSGAFTATGGSGTLTELGGPGLINFSSKQRNGTAMFFRDGGHRGNPGWNGWGWLMASNGPTSGTNDFLFAATPGMANIPEVPVPAALPLLLSALGLFGWYGRRRQRQLAA